MTLILDAAPLVAADDARDPQRSVVRRLITEEPDDLVIPAPVSAEVDYLLGQRLGRRARLAFLSDLAAGRFQVICLDAADYQLVMQYEERYADLDVGLADLSVVALAHRFGTNRIMTFDQRHFRALGPPGGGAFTLHPADAA